MCQIGFSASFSFHKRRHRYEEQVRGGIKMRITPRHLSNLSSKFTVHISHNHASRLTLFWHSQFTTTTTQFHSSHSHVSRSNIDYSPLFANSNPFFFNFEFFDYSRVIVGSNLECRLTGQGENPVIVETLYERFTINPRLRSSYHSIHSLYSSQFLPSTSRS